MRVIGALILALLLGIAAYGGFWLVSLNYNSAQMEGAVEQALGGKLEHGKQEWIPELMQVKVRWPSAVLALEAGPVHTIEMNDIIMVSGFLSHKRWRLLLPPVVKLRMANGRQLTLKTFGAELIWLEQDSRLIFRAEQLEVIGVGGDVLAAVRDVMIERRPTDEGVRINLASRPMFDGQSEGGILSGQVVLPEPVVSALLAYLGGDPKPTRRKFFGLGVERLRLSGRTAVLDNVSFKAGNVSGAIYGDLKVLRNGNFAGQLVITADSPERLIGWLESSGAVDARTITEDIGARELKSRMDKYRPTVRLETIPDAMLLNGYQVGAVPRVADMVNRIWH